MRTVLLLLLGACASRPTGFQHKEFGEQGSVRSYELYVPASAPEPAPLVVALHRFTESGSTMAWVTGFNELANKEGFVVLYPNGPGRRFEFLENDERDDGKLVLSMIEDVAASIAIDRRRIYLTGASNGGFLTYRMASLFPETFAAAAPVMALMPRELADRKGAPMPLLVIHGTADRIVKADSEKLFGGKRFAVLPMKKTLEYWVRRNGSETTPTVDELPNRDPADKTRTKRSSYKGEAPVIYLEVEGGGHTWPGGNERAPRFIVGRVARDFSATELIWNFFRDYAR